MKQKKDKTKTRKRIFILTAAVMLLLVLSGTAFAAMSYNGPGIFLSMTRVEPSPAEPGSYAKVWINIQNTGDNDMPNFKFELMPNFPFSLDPNEVPLREFGEVKSGSQITLSYKIRIDEDAVEGDNPLNFKYSLSGHWMDASIDVPIRTLDAIISIEDITTFSEKVEPGQEAEITISIKNNADSDLRQVNLQIGLINYFTNAGVTVVTELPFTPRKSNEQTVYSLKAGEQKDILFELIVDPDAESKPYKIPLNIDYIDSVGNNYSKTYIIGLVVGGEPDLDVVIEETTISKVRSAGSITLKIVNKGVTDAKFMNVKMKDNGNYKVISSSSFYIGNVDSDDFENAEFIIIPLKKDHGIVELPILLEYKDANNNEYEENIIVELDLEKAKILNAKKSSGGLLVFAIIVLIVGYFLYKRWKKKKEKEKTKQKRS